LAASYRRLGIPPLSITPKVQGIEIKEPSMMMDRMMKPHTPEREVPLRERGAVSIETID
jgi:hypothetical protein